MIPLGNLLLLRGLLENKLKFGDVCLRLDCKLLSGIVLLGRNGEELGLELVRLALVEEVYV